MPALKTLSVLADVHDLKFIGIGRYGAMSISGVAFFEGEETPK